MVDAEVAAHLANYKASGAELIMGRGRFVAPKTVEVRLNGGGTRVVAADRLFLNLGTHAAMPSIPGLADSPAVDEHRAPRARPGARAPRRSRRGVRRSGVRPGIPPLREPRDRHHAPIAAPHSRGSRRRRRDTAHPRRRGDRIRARCRCDPGRERSGDGVRLRVRTGRDERTIAGTDILVATGRTPNTADIGLETAGVELDARGYVKVNDRLETTGRLMGYSPFAPTSHLPVASTRPPPLRNDAAYNRAARGARAVHRRLRRPL